MIDTYAFASINGELRVLPSLW